MLPGGNAASALDVGPSDSLGAEVGLSNPGVTGLGERHPALPLHNEVGQVRRFIEDGESIDAGNEPVLVLFLEFTSFWLSFISEDQ